MSLLSLGSAKLWFPSFLILLGTAFIAISGPTGPHMRVLQNHPLLTPPKLIGSFALGYNEVVADAMWLRTIQDFDYCERRQNNEIDPNAFRCERGWVFTMIDAITELAPNFLQPYESGALMLTVVVNDIEGASVIFDKGVSRFPNYWPILYSASYQAMVEEKNLSKAASLLDRAAQHGAPAWTRSLASRLHQKEGQLDLAKAVLENAVATASDPLNASLFQRRLSEVNAEIKRQKQEHIER